MRFAVNVPTWNAAPGPAAGKALSAYRKALPTVPPMNTMVKSHGSMIFAVDPAGWVVLRAADWLRAEDNLSEIKVAPSVEWFWHAGFVMLFEDVAPRFP